MVFALVAVRSLDILGVLVSICDGDVYNLLLYALGLLFFLFLLRLRRPWFCSLPAFCQPLYENLLLDVAQDGDFGKRWVDVCLQNALTPVKTSVS